MGLINAFIDCLDKKWGEQAMQRTLDEQDRRIAEKHVISKNTVSNYVDLPAPLLTGAPDELPHQQLSSIPTDLSTGYRQH